MGKKGESLQQALLRTLEDRRPAVPKIETLDLRRVRHVTRVHSASGANVTVTAGGAAGPVPRWKSSANREGATHSHVGQLELAAIPSSLKEPPVLEQEQLKRALGGTNQPRRLVDHFFGVSARLDKATSQKSSRNRRESPHPDRVAIRVRLHQAASAQDPQVPRNRGPAQRKSLR